MATLYGVFTPTLCSLASPLRHVPESHKSEAVLSSQIFVKTCPSKNPRLLRRKTNRIISSLTEDREVVPVNNKQAEDGTTRLKLNGSDEHKVVSPSSSDSSTRDLEGDGSDKLMSRAVNAIIVLGFGTFAVSKLLTIDHDNWHGWTLYEILRYAPEHNWIAYEQALKANPLLAKMAISGVVYSIGDWIAQCYEGKPLFEFDRARLFRSGLAGFTLHGSLSHYYYQICEDLFPFQGWWVVPAKVAFDQTVWSAIWNSIYFVVLGFLRMESAANIYDELKSTFWPMLTAGWKLWPFAHLITYGVIPVEQRLLWVDCIELIWVTILSTYSNEKSEARISEVASEGKPSSSSDHHSKVFAVLPYQIESNEGISFFFPFWVSEINERKKVERTSGKDPSGPSFTR